MSARGRQQLFEVSEVATATLNTNSDNTHAPETAQQSSVLGIREEEAVPKYPSFTGAYLMLNKTKNLCRQKRISAKMMEMFEKFHLNSNFKLHTQNLMSFANVQYRNNWL